MDNTTLREGIEAFRAGINNQIASFNFDFIEEVIKLLLRTTEKVRPHMVNPNWGKMETILAETIAKIKKIKE